MWFRSRPSIAKNVSVRLFLNARLKHSPGNHRTKAACESSRAFQLGLVILKKKNTLILGFFFFLEIFESSEAELWTGLW